MEGPLSGAALRRALKRMRADARAERKAIARINRSAAGRQFRKENPISKPRKKRKKKGARGGKKRGAGSSG